MRDKVQLRKEDLPKINKRVDWRALFAKLGLLQDKQSKPNDLWAKSPFNPNENTASFHLNEAGFFCHSTGRNGDFIRLIQELYGMDCYNAARWLIYQGLTQEQKDDAPKPPVSREEKKELVNNWEKTSSIEKENAGIKHNLEPFLSQQGTHPEFVRRGIGVATCKLLRCGYLDPEKNKARLAGRLVWQVRDVNVMSDGSLKSFILTHLGRAVTEEDQTKDGKWWHYPGFHKTQALYGIDLALTLEAANQAKAVGWVVVVEGCFDVAKMVEAGLINVVATFGAHLSQEQAKQLQWMTDRLGINKILLAYDRDKAGEQGQIAAMETLQEVGLTATGFDWQRGFESPNRGRVAFPNGVKDICDFRIDQLAWLRARGLL